MSKPRTEPIAKPMAATPPPVDIVPLASARPNSARTGRVPADKNLVQGLKPFRPQYEYIAGEMPGSLAVVYARQSDSKEDRQNFTEVQQGLRYAAAEAFGLPSENVALMLDIESGRLPIQQREKGRELWEMIGAGRVSLVIAIEFARIFRDVDALDVGGRSKKVAKREIEREFLQNASEFSLHCRSHGTCCAVRDKHRNFIWFDFVSDDARENFALYAKSAGDELLAMRNRLELARSRATSKGQFTGGCARVGLMAVQAHKRYPLTGIVAQTPQQILYPPHARVVTRIWEESLSPRVNNYQNLYRLCTREVLTFEPFPEDYFDHALDSSPFKVMKCQINQVTRRCSCAPDYAWSEKDAVQGDDGQIRFPLNHYVWRTSAILTNGETIYPPLPYALLRPVLPSVFMFSALLTHPIYLGDRLVCAEALTQYGLFRGLYRAVELSREVEGNDRVDAEEADAPLSAVDSELDLLRIRAENVMNHGHMPHMRLCRGGVLSAEDERYLCHVGLLNSESGDDNASLSPIAQWRPDEATFWQVCEKWCVVDMRAWHDSGYSPWGLLVNKKCVIARGRPQAASEHVVYGGYAACLRHGFEDFERDGGRGKRPVKGFFLSRAKNRVVYKVIDRAAGGDIEGQDNTGGQDTGDESCHASSPPPRRRKVGATQEKTMDKIIYRLSMRCYGDQKRDGSEPICSEYGSDDAFCRILDAHLGAYLRVARTDAKVMKKIQNIVFGTLGEDARALLRAVETRISADIEGAYTKYDAAQESLDSVRTDTSKLAVLRARDEARLLTKIASIEEEIKYLSSERNRVLAQLGLRDTKITTEQINEACEDWAAFRKANMPGADTVLRTVTNWIGMLVESSSLVRECLTVIEMRDGENGSAKSTAPAREYLLSFRPKSPDRNPWQEDETQWMRANWLRPDLTLKQIVARFPSRAIGTIKYHAHKMRLLRTTLRGGRGIGAGIWGKAAQIPKSAQPHWADEKENKGVLYAALSGHPRSAKTMTLFGEWGVQMQTIDIPSDVRRRLRDMVKRLAPDLP